MARILVLYYSDGGATQALANEIVFGIESVTGVEAMMRTVPNAKQAQGGDVHAVPDAGALYVSAEDVQTCDGIALGSPIHYGQMASPLVHFFEANVGLWLNGALIDKPATVFASGGSLHGGQEMILLSMQVLLLHHGAVIMGIPYNEKALSTTTAGGTPYGATAVQKMSGQALTANERQLAQAQGKRLARWVLK